MTIPTDRAALAAEAKRLAHAYRWAEEGYLRDAAAALHSAIDALAALAAPAQPSAQPEPERPSAAEADEREAFNAWWSTPRTVQECEAAKHSDLGGHKYSMWEAWQARAALSHQVVDAPAVAGEAK